MKQPKLSRENRQWLAGEFSAQESLARVEVFRFLRQKLKHVKTARPGDKE